MKTVKRSNISYLLFFTFAPPLTGVCLPLPTVICLQVNFYKPTLDRGRAILFFFSPQSKYCCQGNMCNQRAPSDIKPKQGIIKCIYTHINIQIIFQIHRFLSVLSCWSVHHFLYTIMTKVDADIEMTVCCSFVFFCFLFFSCIQIKHIQVNFKDCRIWAGIWNTLRMYCKCTHSFFSSEDSYIYRF